MGFFVAYFMGIKHLNFCSLPLLNAVEHKCMISYENSLIIKHEDPSKSKI